MLRASNHQRRCRTLVYPADVRYTQSYVDHVPSSVIDRFEIREVRSAAAVLAATNPRAFADIGAVLDGFRLIPADILEAGGNESNLAARLNAAFRARGWREAKHDIHSVITRTVKPYEDEAGGSTEEVSDSVGYWIDNVKGRVVLDVEWNAKDGNLDRDLGHYRALYELEVIDGAVMVTRTQEDLRRLGAELGKPSWLSTTTTTNLPKLETRLSMGAAGGCPFIAFAITARCFSDA